MKLPLKARIVMQEVFNREPVSMERVAVTCDLESDTFYDVLADALSLTFDDPTRERLNAEPERRALVLSLHGIVSELVIWTGMPEDDVKARLGCVRTYDDLLFKEDVQVLGECETYLELVRDLCLAAPFEEAATSLIASVEIFRRAGRSVEVATAAVDAESPLTDASAREMFVKGQPAVALLHALAAPGMREVMDLTPMSRDRSQQVVAAVGIRAAALAS